VARPSRSKHLPYFALLEALTAPGCALCHLAAAAAGRYIRSLCWEYVNDDGARRRLRASGGLCRDHTRALEAWATPLTRALLSDDLLAQFERELSEWEQGRSPRPADDVCPACEAADRQQARSRRILVEFFDEPEFAEVWQASAGFCRPHTLSVLSALPTAARRRFAQRDRERLAALRRELAEVRRKSDYRFADEPWGEERTSPSRALARLCGEAETATRPPNRG